MTTILGIRHHGPGCARSVVRALEKLRPDLVLIEGPPTSGTAPSKPTDLASGMLGAIIKDPVQDPAVFREYLETVLKERDGWKDLFRACRDQLD